MGLVPLMANWLIKSGKAIQFGASRLNVGGFVAELVIRVLNKFI